MIEASVAIDNALVLNSALARMRTLGENTTPIFDAIGQYGESSTRLRFKKGIGPDGARWKPSRRAIAAGGQTLVMKGAQGGLLGSITHRASSTSAEWGSNKIYAGIHQMGGVIKPKSKKNLRFAVPGGFVSTKRVTIPARPYLGVNAEDGREIQAITLDVVQAAEAGRIGGA